MEGILFWIVPSIGGYYPLITEPAGEHRQSTTGWRLAPWDDHHHFLVGGCWWYGYHSHLGVVPPSGCKTLQQMVRSLAMRPRREQALRLLLPSAKDVQDAVFVHRRWSFRPTESTRWFGTILLFSISMGLLESTSIPWSSRTSHCLVPCPSKLWQLWPSAQLGHGKCHDGRVGEPVPEMTSFPNLDGSRSCVARSLAQTGATIRRLLRQPLGFQHHPKRDL